jgi:hypothetical protein
MKTTVTICAILAILGGTYGFVSAKRNQNPYYSVSGDLLVPQEDMGKAWHWQPSPVWLPSYILCVVPRNGFGISHSRSGYLFRSQEEETAYTMGSTMLGIGVGCLLWIVVGMVVRSKRRSNKQIHPIAGKPGSG